MNRVLFKLKIILNLTLVSLFFSLLVSCAEEEEEQGTEPTTENTNDIIAQVDDAKLYRSEILGLVPPKTKKEDSLKIIDDFVQSWIKTKLILQQAEETEDINLKRIEENVQEYKNSLLAFELEKKYLSTKLDTTIKETEIKEFYQKNESNFVLQQPILKLYYIKVPLIAPDIDTLSVLMQNLDEDVLKRLKSYSQRNADAYYLNSNQWKYWDAVVEDLGEVVAESQEQLLQKGTFFEKRTQTHLYLVKVLESQRGTQKAPLEFVRGRIKNLILNQRKASLIKEFEQNIYEEGKKENKFKIYYK